jgi:hypothetical protein
VLSLDSFLSQSWADSYEQNQFLDAEPLTLPFSLPLDISLSADSLIYNGWEYSDFVYSGKSAEQSMSITDAENGSMLATIKKTGSKYGIALKLNQFSLAGNLLGADAPLNISDTVVTAEAALETSGVIAYDFWNNISGSVDISMDGGILRGMGTDGLYANALLLTRNNVADMLAAALDSGETKIKSLHMAGEYENGNFRTTAPFSLKMRHAVATGHAGVTDGKMSLEMNLLLRGAAPDPRPIQIAISPYGAREYSLSDILIWLDPDYMAEFVASHDRY